MVLPLIGFLLSYAVIAVFGMHLGYYYQATLPEEIGRFCVKVCIISMMVTLVTGEPPIRHPGHFLLATVVFLGSAYATYLYNGGERQPSTD